VVGGGLRDLPDRRLRRALRGSENDLDYAALADAAKAGRIEVETDLT